MENFYPLLGKIIVVNIEYCERIYMKPKILLSVNIKKEFYIDAVNYCGGIAVPKYCPEVSTEYDGLILCGGNDINPSYYGE